MLGETEVSTKAYSEGGVGRSPISGMPREPTVSQTPTALIGMLRRVRPSCGGC